MQWQLSDQSTLWGYERAARRPSLDTLARMCAVYEVELYDFIRQSYFDSLRLLMAPMPGVFAANRDWLTWAAMFAYTGQPMELLPLEKACCSTTLCCSCDEGCACTCYACHLAPVPPPSLRGLMMPGPARPLPVFRNRAKGRKPDSLADARAFLAKPIDTSAELQHS